MWHLSWTRTKLRNEANFGLCCTSFVSLTLKFQGLLPLESINYSKPFSNHCLTIFLSIYTYQPILGRIRLLKYIAAVSVSIRSIPVDCLSFQAHAFFFVAKEKEGGICWAFKKVEIFFQCHLEGRHVYQRLHAWIWST